MGIDYGRGITNINTETGVRFGIISANKISGESMGQFIQPDLPPCCPKCGNDKLKEGEDTEFFCDFCEEPIEDDEAYSAYEYYEGPLIYEDAEYSLQWSPDTNDIIILRSPWKVMAGYCSPCFPGGVYLTDKSEDDWGHALGPEWFDPDYAPIPYTPVPV